MNVSAQSAAPDTAPNGWPQGLLRGFREGRSDAFEEIYRRHAREVTAQLRYGFAFTASGRHHRFVGYRSAFELHDALHETFRRAFEPAARSRYDGLRPFGPYLKAIARNVVLRGFRAREVQFPEVGDDGERGGGPIEIVDETQQTPEQEVGRQQVRDMVAAFLDTLPPADRELLSVRFIEGLSQRDAAARLGLGRQQVRGREVKLRRQLVRYLQEQGEQGLVAARMIMPMWGPPLAELLGEVLR